MIRRLFLAVAALSFLVAAPARAAAPVSICNPATASAPNCATTSAIGVKRGVDVSMPGGNPCQSPSATLISKTGTTAGTAAVEIVPLAANQTIYLCSLNVVGVSGTTPTFSLVQGTGVACGTGQSVLVQAWSTTAGALYAFAGPIAVGKVGESLCYLDSGTTPVQRYTLTYVQQ